MDNEEQEEYEAARFREAARGRECQKAQEAFLRERRVGLGGALSCLFAALGGPCRPLPRWWLCPLWAPFLAIAALISPSLAALWLGAGLRRGGASVSKIKAGDVLWGGAVWWAGLGLAFYLISDLTDKITSRYEREVELFRQGAGDAPGQERFVNSLQSLYALGTFFLLLLAALIMIRALKGLTSLDRVSPVKVMTLSMPGLIVICAAAVGFLGACERLFAVMKLRAIAHIMRQEPYFDPALPFLALRLFLAGVFFAALGVCALRALGLAHRGPDAA